MAGAPPLAVRGSEPQPHDSSVPAASKFHPPDPRRQWVPRQRLIEHLAAGDAKLALVHAPAGFGKTIAVAQWRAAEIEDRAFAWLSLDPGDDDPVSLWSHIIFSLQRACPRLGGGDLLALLRARLPDISGRRNVLCRSPETKSSPLPTKPRILMRPIMALQTIVRVAHIHKPSCYTGRLQNQPLMGASKPATVLGVKGLHFRLEPAGVSDHPTSPAAGFL